MYHEVSRPYAFLWRMRQAVKHGGLGPSSSTPTARRPVHGIPPALLKCEFAALGLKPVQVQGRLAGGDVYLMAFGLAAPRPLPQQIEPCKA